MTRTNSLLIRSAGKVILLPVIILLTILQWICNLAVSISTLFFSLVGGIFIATGILSYAFGQEPVNIMWRMIMSGIIICVFPKIGEWIAVQIAYLNLLAKHWMMS